MLHWFGFDTKGGLRIYGIFGQYVLQIVLAGPLNKNLVIPWKGKVSSSIGISTELFIGNRNPSISTQLENAAMPPSPD